MIVSMGKKNDPSKPGSAVAEIPESKKTTKPVPEAAGSMASPPATGGDGSDGAPAKAAPKKKPAKKKPAPYSTEDIALRAYFISEKRHQRGLHGDSHSDWIQAERQLRAEHRKKAAKKSVRSKKRV